MLYDDGSHAHSLLAVLSFLLNAHHLTLGADKRILRAVNDSRGQGECKVESRAWEKLSVDCEVDPAGRNVTGPAAERLRLRFQH